ncbi:uncharacterized protein LOC126088137 [Schistocerca cancellata]|uniref:uncharacterized protein LOC126088137 n=1 Tax=Schistocerca cancellata TaxID=274614 RepID=UPI00211810B6|nr:uncharacterized protein LOC126088137 [Schistocerca cancellata]
MVLPSSGENLNYINISNVFRILPRDRGKFAGIVDKCHLTLNHNHSIDSASSLKYRKPSREVKETLISLSLTC